MKTKATLSLISRLSKLITNGQPLWAILWANEYKEELGPVHLALVKRAKQKMRELDYQVYSSDTTQSAIDGTLYVADQALWKLEQPINLPIRKIISMAGRRTKRYQIGLPSQKLYARGN